MRWLAVALATVVLAGCGGASGVAPASYVKSICTTLTSWKNDVQTASASLQASAPKTTSLPQGKQQYVTFVGALVNATRQAASGLKSAGVPAVSGGQDVSTALVQTFSSATSALAQAASQAAGIPITSAAAYQAAASGVTAQIRGSLASMAKITPRKNPQLRAAAAKEPACQALASGG
jgi:hypothetical protein